MRRLLSRESREAGSPLEFERFPVSRCEGFLRERLVDCRLEFCLYGLTVRVCALGERLVDERSEPEQDSSLISNLDLACIRGQSTGHSLEIWWPSVACHRGRE